MRLNEETYSRIMEYIKTRDPSDGLSINHMDLLMVKAVDSGVCTTEESLAFLYGTWYNGDFS
jgi:hypothetical protein